MGDKRKPLKKKKDQASALTVKPASAETKPSVAASPKKTTK
jgi:hypothetical protein